MNNWLDDLFTALERNIRNYKRPDDWETRLNKLKERPRKPVRNQFEGRRSSKMTDSDFY